MPMETDIRDDDRIIIVKFIGQITAEDIETVNYETVHPVLRRHAPEYVDIIWSVQELEIDFQTFIKALGNISKRRNHIDTPSNHKQHFVGKNSWINNLRTWMQKNYSEDTSSFATVEDAITYITS